MIWKRAEGEASHQPPPTVPRVSAHPLRVKELDMCEHQSEPMLGEPSQEFPGSDGASSLEVDICPNNTQSYARSGGWGLEGKDKARESD